MIRAAGAGAFKIRNNPCNYQIPAWLPIEHPRKDPDSSLPAPPSPGIKRTSFLPASSRSLSLCLLRRLAEKKVVKGPEINAERQIATSPRKRPSRRLRRRRRRGSRPETRIRKTRGRVNSKERYQDEQPSCSADFRLSFDARHDDGGIGRTVALITEVYELPRRGGELVC